jgi:hypothetical protein
MAANRAVAYMGPGKVEVQRVALILDMTSSCANSLP